MKNFRCYLILPLSLVLFAPLVGYGWKSKLKNRASSYFQSVSQGFIENKGQLVNDKGKPVPDVLFRSVIPGGDLYLTRKGLTYAFYKAETEEEERDPESDKGTEEHVAYESYRMDVDLEGASIHKENIIEEDADVCQFNFFYAHCPDGIMHVRQYKKVTIKNIYPGIDWVWQVTANNQLKYDFILRPGADPSAIKMIYRGADLKLKENGEALLVKTPLCEFTEGKLISYLNGSKTASRFRLHKNEVSIEVTSDLLPGNTLLIDPPITWCTLYSGSGYTGIKAAECDTAGNLFVTGYTNSPNFPTQNAGTFFQGALVMYYDVFILKFNKAGVRLWATYYGAGDDDVGNDIRLDVSGNVFVTGSSKTTNGFPVHDPGGGAYYQPANGGAPAQDAFMLKFDNAGNRLWATYFGGSDLDVGNSIFIDNNGDVFMTGITVSNNMPTKNAGGFFQGSNAGFAEAMLTKFSNSGVLLWASYYGGTGREEGYGVTTDASGNIFFTGQTKSNNLPTQNNGNYFDGTFNGISDLFVLKFDNALNRQWATYLGGNNEEDLSHIITTSNGDLYLVGYTASNDFTIVANGVPGSYNDASFNGIGDAVFVKFSNAGTLLWSTYYGGTGNELNTPYDYDRIAKDGCENIYFTISTRSGNMPTKTSDVSDYLQGTYKGANDLFMSKFTNTGIQKWGTYFGGTNDELRGGIAIDRTATVYQVGEFSGYQNTNGLALQDQGNGAYYQNTLGGVDDSYIMRFKYTPLTLNVSSTPSCTCDGSATVVPSGGSFPYSFVWNTNPPQYTATANNLCGGNYMVTVSDDNCNTSIITVTVPNSGPDASIASITDVTSCAGANGGAASINVTGGAQPLTYKWYPNVGNSPNISGVGAGLYYFVVKDANGCFDSIPVLIKQATGTSPVAAFTATPEKGQQPLTVTFTNQSTNATSYQWIFGDGNTSTQQDPTNTFQNSGTYEVKLIVTNNAGCSDTIMVTIEVLGHASLIVPNVFTPNGDGQNDLFKVIASGIKEFEIHIYNRWGEVVAEYSDVTQGWDGKSKSGGLVPSGTYYYVIKALGVDEKDYSINGFITVQK